MRARGWELPFGGQHGVAWNDVGDRYWLFCDNRERLICMVNAWTWSPSRNHCGGHVLTSMRTLTTVQVGSRGRAWELPFREVFEVLGYRYHRDGMGFQGAERTTCKGLGNWWRDKYIYRSKTVPVAGKCKRVRSHVYSTVLNGSINWPWSGAMINKVGAWEAKDTASHREASQEAGRNVGGLQIRTSRSLRKSWWKIGLPLLTENFE